MVEFLVFVLVGELLVLALATGLFGEVDHKLRLELFAAQVARAYALGNGELESVLRTDYRLPNAKLNLQHCGFGFTCISVLDDGVLAQGVSR